MKFNLLFRMSKMVSIKVPHAQFKYHVVILISLIVVVTGTRYYDNIDDSPEFIVNSVDYILENDHFDISRIASVDKPVHPNYDIAADSMNNIDDREVFENHFNEDDFSGDGVSLGPRFGDSSDVKENNENFVSRPPAISCIPRLTIVPLKAPKPGVLLMPPCLMVPRCGACCFFGWKCVPFITEAFTYSIKEAEYEPKTERFMIKRLFNVTKKHHTACKCKCDVNPKDCYSRDQIYDYAKCKCICQNELENKFQCSQRGRQWNSDSCTCDCPVVTCEEGYFFDQEKCKCDF